MSIPEQVLAICDLRAANFSWRIPENDDIINNIIKTMSAETIDRTIFGRQGEIREMETKLSNSKALEIKKKGLAIFETQCKLLSV